MLQKSKDQWQKKVEDDYLEAETEKEREAALAQNQMGWERRKQESQWLLKGVGKVDDNKMSEFLNNAERTK